jgi:hypothetical protein
MEMYQIFVSKPGSRINPGTDQDSLQSQKRSGFEIILADSLTHADSHACNEVTCICNNFKAEILFTWESAVID